MCALGFSYSRTQSEQLTCQVLAILKSENVDQNAV